MATEFEPNLSILPTEQRQLWSELGSLPPSFVLCGGTAIAVQLGHRQSLDFDFISNVNFDPDDVYSNAPVLQNSHILQKGPNTLTCGIDRDKRVLVSLFGAPSMRLNKTPLIARDNRIHVAQLLDLAGMKAAVVQKRAESKDYVDLDAIIARGEISLPMALAAGKGIYGRPFNPELTIKALCFFGDGDLASLALPIRDRLVAAARDVDPERLPAI